jgi:hypothetical protein
MPRRRSSQVSFRCLYCGGAIAFSLDDVSYAGNPPRAVKIARCFGCGSENIWHGGRDTLDPWKPSRAIAEKNQDLELRELAAFIRTTLDGQTADRVIDSDFAAEAPPLLAAIDSGDRAAAIRAVGEYLQRRGELGPVPRAYFTFVWARRLDGASASRKEEILAGVPAAVRTEVAAAIERHDWDAVEHRLIAMEHDRLHARAELVIFQTRDVAEG